MARSQLYKETQSYTSNMIATRGMVNISQGVFLADTEFLRVEHSRILVVIKIIVADKVVMASGHAVTHVVTHFNTFPGT